MSKINVKSKSKSKSKSSIRLFFCFCFCLNSNLAGSYNSIYLNAKSSECALLSAGSVVQLTEDVVTGKVKNAVAVVRPPGHHAECAEAMGFCLFNNVGVAAEVVKRKHGVKRVLIVDWDVHHGNATQNMFLDDPAVLYVSLHRYDNGLFYPGPSGSPDIVGTKEGTGRNVNIGWNTRNVGDGAYLAAFNLVILPICEEYRPELIIISAGFDSAEGDYLGGIKVTPGGYAQLTRMLMNVCEKVVVVLEGGYNIRSISLSMAAVVSTLLGDEPQAARDPNTLDVSCLQSIYTTLRHHQKHWKNLEGVEIPDFKSLTLSPGKSPAKSPAKPAASAASAAASPASSPSKPSGSSSSSSSSSASASSSSSSASTSSSNPAASSSNPAASSSSPPTASSREQGFAVNPLRTCPHLNHVKPLPEAGIDIHKGCEDCGGGEENWVCLSCYRTGCSRYQKGHMKKHSEEQSHAMVLSFSDLSVWCFSCENYLDNPALREAIDHCAQKKFA